MTESLIEQKYVVIEKVLNHDTVEILLHGDFNYVKNLSKKRKIEKNWAGVFNLELDFFKFIKLPDGRLDISLPLTILESLQIELLKKITILKGYKIVHLNLLINHPNQNTQEWHQDNGKLGAEDYYTLLIPLTDHPDIKKTEVLQPYTYKFSKASKVVVPSLKIGDGLLFSGCLWHRGMPNYSNITRYCLYAIIVKNEIDEAQLFEGWK